MPPWRPGCDVGNSVNRYVLAWVSLAILAVAAASAWWALTQPAPPDSPLWGNPHAAQTAPTAASTPGLWHPPPAGQALKSASAPSTQPSSTTAQAADAQGLAGDDVLSHGFVSASLAALSAHGLRLNQPQVSLHTVQTVDLPAAQALGRWARTQGFAVHAPIKVLEHGGEVNWLLPIERRAVLDVAQILADGQHIRARAQQTPGARYHTWQVPVGGRSTLAGAAQS